MAITLPFSDDFASGTSPSGSVYTAIAGSLTDYTVASSFALVADPHTSTDQREGFYTTDTVSGDFDVKWKLNMTENPVGQTGTVHGVALWIDNNNMIKMWRYYRSDLGWHNPSCQKVVSGSTTTLHDNTSAGGDSDTGNYDRYYRIKKSGTTFTFYTSPDGSTWTTEYTGTISDWLSTQAWHVMTYGENNANTNLLKLDRLTIDPLTTTYNQTVAAVGAGVAAMTKGMSKTLAATGAGSANVTKQLSKTLAAIGAGAAVVKKQMAKTLAAIGAGTAVLTATKVYLVTLTAVGAGVAVLTKTPGKLLATTAAGAATMLKSVPKTLAATAAGTAAVKKQMGVILRAIGAGQANVVAGILYMRTLAATASASAAIGKQVGKVLKATGAGVATMSSSRAVIMAVTANATAVMGKQVGKVLTTVAVGIAYISTGSPWKRVPRADDGSEWTRQPRP